MSNKCLNITESYQGIKTKGKTQEVINTVRVKMV